MAILLVYREIFGPSSINFLTSCSPCKRTGPLSRFFSSQPRLASRAFFRPDFQNEQQLISRLCRESKFKEAIECLCQGRRLKDAVKLLEHRIDHPSAVIYSVLLQFCIQHRALEEGKRVHNHITLSKFMPGIFISNKIIDLYCKCNCVEDAHKVFDKMGERDLCSWNTLISGYAKMGQMEKARVLFDAMPDRDSFSWTAMVSGYVKKDKPKDALELFRQMQWEKLPSNKFTISSALAASASIPSLQLGKEIHGHIVRSALDSDAVVWSALSDMYGKCGSTEEARYVFNKTWERDVVSWTAMINRYFEDARWEEGFLLFSDLLRSGVRPNDFTFAGVLNACAQQTIEGSGKQVHGYMLRLGFDPLSFAASSLVHMYSKCGNISSAYNVFKFLPTPDLVSWTSLINGYAQNGQPHESLRLFDLLLTTGLKLDHITFVGVLSACTHAGLVDKGVEIFHSIKDKHGLMHTVDHYACVIDLLSRAGKFREAKEMISKMPMKPDKFIWASLLGGCRIHGNLELAKQAAEALVEVESENAATYVTLANIYATAGKWSEVEKVRKTMDKKRVVKKPGMSWIDVKRTVNVFLVGDKSHPKTMEIYGFLGEISKRMKEEGYNPGTDFVLHDVEEEQKEESLTFHSEKLAVAFGIIATPPGTQIKVFKNLRTCVDCHSAIKFISRISERTIIVRDSARFHRFESGSCSCNDYW